MTVNMTLPARLDVAAAGQLAEDLRSRLSDTGDIVIDAGPVAHLGALCLQVLLAAATSAHAAGRGFRLIQMSDRVLEQARYMGFTPETIAEGKP
ncbi:STAS domain-containing protein [Pseudooceanicola nanhaiensis]|uniref:STAS domain-containing protein n=1 Tax=Pseudooceanicola nanhaiensis TaxID=375761 RepID=UPI001CD2B9CD|nr:STAS domain-containing protein [Pseudooceanicola nanhaiensis]MCA0921661.1 STAS domain-containing protein [Pseudooceanicola nanhaiensis]